MMRALFSAISGMRNHMSYMDVVGNNIANVNTIAYKSSRVTFQDILGQTIKGASSPQNGRGGTNAAQIGLGMNLGGIDNIMTQGSLQSTGKLTDFAIQGDGFFVVSDGQREFYTRDGAFDIGVDGGLVNPVTGLRVMGWSADSTGFVDVEGPLTALEIPFGTRISAQPTTSMKLTGNLDAGTPTYSAGPPIVGVVNTTITAYDALGNAHTVKLEYRKNAAANTWDVVGTFDDGDADTTADDAATIAPGQIVFDGTTGNLTTPASGLINITLPTLPGDAAEPLAFDVDMSAFSQFAGQSQVNLSTQDGFPAGALVSFAVGSSGEISGIYSNGSNRVIGQLALATFVNPGGMQRAGQNLWTPSANSGDAIVGQPNSNGRGTVNTGTLESSNVDLALQFTNVILAQRGFQSSSRVITASDQLLQDLVNIIR
ncbi:MAG: flagellar hook protein FlgE [Dehalococcoidia bacterium]|nr:flagellar hook protein FlgE [Dehalococcoidia bacterium]